MKRLKITTLIVMLIAIVISSAVYINRTASKSDNSKKNESTATTKVPEDDSLTFSVLGDVHGNAGKLDNAINDLHSVKENMDAMILNGDNVDQGLKSQYDAIKNTLNKDHEILPKTIIKNIGNHDYFDYQRGPNKPEDVERFKNMYLDFAGEKSVYHDTWIKGYHFISLGSESGNTKELGAVNAFLSQKQLDWLKEKLAEKHEKGKPIFVFLHQHLSTSIKGWIGVEQRRELNKILSSYPEVILFTSHTHVLLSVDNIKQNQPFTTAHTGAVSYAILPEDYKIKRLYDEIQGLYVEVKGNKTTIKGRDFAKNLGYFQKRFQVQANKF
ncbi:metallophosphoesterase [Clostridium sp. OS1-26]|uniref:metallophosphoesterase family protein n=1 Tax=Clostridium sp. OS1-26 TaxID=3070681 RepID=UPI0027E13033|nr:metallophosphoesterase [Clostridium sp. OS1-26]WML34648.1 metallophosphoesterase [Clostridium sp. OS1-26]